MRRIPPLNAVRIFEAAARKKSFTGAAGELNITVTAVSHQVKQLEELLGVRLFDRGSGTATLSVIGERLFPLLQRGFDHIEEAFAEIEERKSNSVVSITTTRSFAEHWLVPRLTKFRAAFPNIAVNLDASDLTVDLRAGETDIAIRYGRKGTDGTDAVHLLDDNYIVVCHHSIGARSAVPRIDDFDTRPLLSYRWTNLALSGPDWASWFRLSPQLDPNRFRFSCFGEEGLAIQAMEHGYGPLLCADVLVDHSIDQGLCLIVEGPVIPGFSYRILTAPTSTRKRSVRGFLDWIQGEAASATRSCSSGDAVSMLSGTQLMLNKKR